MKKIILLFSFIVVSCTSNIEKENPIKIFQNDLVENGLTGSNVAMVYQNGEIVYKLRPQNNEKLLREIKILRGVSEATLLVY